MEHPIREHEIKFADIRKELEENRKILSGGLQRITSLESDCKNLKDKTANREREMLAMEKLANNTERLAADLSRVVNKVEEHEQEIIELKYRPSKKISSYVEHSLLYLLMAVLGYVIAQIL